MFSFLILMLHSRPLVIKFDLIACFLCNFSFKTSSFSCLLTSQSCIIRLVKWNYNWINLTWPAQAPWLSMVAPTSAIKVEKKKLFIDQFVLIELQDASHETVDMSYLTSLVMEVLFIILATDDMSIFSWFLDYYNTKMHFIMQLGSILVSSGSSIRSKVSHCTT